MREIVGVPVVAVAQFYVQGTCLQIGNRVSEPVQEKTPTHQCNKKKGECHVQVGLSQAAFSSLMTSELQSLKPTCIVVASYLYLQLCLVLYSVPFPCDLHLKCKYDLVFLLKYQGQKKWDYFQGKLWSSIQHRETILWN